MSAGWVLLVLLFISPFYDAADVEDDKSSTITGRHRRSIMQLRDMVKAVTGREGYEFVSYGNWCGLGGSGSPLDPIDECCQNHDICYDVAKPGACRERGEKGVYQLEYQWRMAGDETAVCEDEDDHCKMTICLCDAVLSNCLKSNLDFYNPSNYKKVDLYQLIQDADFLTS